MRTLVVLLAMLCCSYTSRSQGNPVNWEFYSTKIKDTVYQLHMVARMSPSWYLYSLYNETNFPFKTVITFKPNNDIIIAEEEVKEKGVLQTILEKNTSLTAKYYEHKVEFTKLVYIRMNRETVLTGKIDYGICNQSSSGQTERKRLTEYAFFAFHKKYK